MNMERKETIVGGAVALALIGAIFASYGLKNSADGGDSYSISAVFSRVDGLPDDAEVRMGGVEVGRVTKADLDPSYRAVISMSISNDIVVPTDSSAVIHTDGIFGTKFIELEPGGELESLKNGDRIEITQSSVVVEELLELIISEGKKKQAAE